VIEQANKFKTYEYDKEIFRLKLNLMLGVFSKFIEVDEEAITDMISDAFK